MANKKITELTELPVAGQNDVLPIVDLAGPETKKIKVSGLKSSLSLTRSDVGLSNVDNTSDANKPISTATQAALDLKANSADVYTKTQSDTNFEPKNPNIQAHIADLANPHQVTKAQVGLDQVDNTSDAAKPISTATQTALNLKEDAANKGATNGYAPLVAGTVPAIYLPSYVDDVIEVANFAALPNPGEVSKVYVTLDTHKTYRWSGTTYVEVSPSDVNSVNGHTGIVVLDKSDIGLGNVNNTSDLNKPISTATQSALDLKLNIPSTGTDHYVDGMGGTQLFSKQTHLYRNVNLRASGNPVDIYNWANNYRHFTNNQHFLASPEQYLNCKWRVQFVDNNTGNQVSLDIGPFPDIPTASTQLSIALGSYAFSSLYISPYYLQDESIPVLRTGFGYNTNFQKLFKKKYAISGADRSFRINSVCTAVHYDYNTSILRNIFTQTLGISDPFPADPTLWDASHYGIFTKIFKKKQKTKFLKSGRQVGIFGTNKPRYYYDSTTSTFNQISSMVFSAGNTKLINGSDGNVIKEKLLYAYEKSNLLDGNLHSIPLINGTFFAIMIKDYHKNAVCVSGMPTDPGAPGDPIYAFEAVVVDNNNNEKVYQVPATTMVGGDRQMIQYSLSGINLPPIPGSVVKFRLRDKVTNRVGRFAKFMLKVVKRGPICVVDNVPNEED